MTAGSATALGGGSELRQPSEVIKRWIAAVNAEAHGLTCWESSFMMSLTDQFERSGSISERQEEILEKIYAEKTP